LLSQASPAIESRKAGHIQDYCHRTVEKAMQEPEMQQAIAQRLNRGAGDEPVTLFPSRQGGGKKSYRLITTTTTTTTEVQFCSNSGYGNYLFFNYFYPCKSAPNFYYES